jgi:hypothetical protein
MADVPRAESYFADVRTALENRIAQLERPVSQSVGSVRASAERRHMSFDEYITVDRLGFVHPAKRPDPERTQLIRSLEDLRKLVDPLVAAGGKYRQIAGLSLEPGSVARRLLDAYDAWDISSDFFAPKRSPKALRELLEVTGFTGRVTLLMDDGINVYVGFPQLRGIEDAYRAWRDKSLLCEDGTSYSYESVVRVVLPLDYANALDGSDIPRVSRGAPPALPAPPRRRPVKPA